MDAGMELDLVRVSRIDGTLCALLALESGTEGHPLLDAEDLRAVPLGAWWTAMRALGLVDDVEKRVQRIHALTEQRPELWAVLFVLGRLRNSNRSIQVQLDQLELNLPPERPVLSLADSDELVPHVLRPSDLKKETWAQLLRGWLAPGLAEPHYDPDLFAQGVGPEPLEGWFKTLPAEQVRRLRAPFRLAVAAARTSLDPEMAHESRLRVRRFFLERSVRRHWREMRPIIDGLHLAALRFYWRRLNLARDSDAELFTHQLEEHLVISDAAISQMYAKDRGTNGTT
jgi:hypothetical protein